jgi:hypothetical protein
MLTLGVAHLGFGHDPPSARARDCARRRTFRKRCCYPT